MEKSCHRLVLCFQAAAFHSTDEQITACALNPTDLCEGIRAGSLA
jgi:hypothetical protein